MDAMALVKSILTTARSTTFRAEDLYAANRIVRTLTSAGFGRFLAELPLHVLPAFASFSEGKLAYLGNLQNDDSSTFVYLKKVSNQNDVHLWASQRDPRGNRSVIIKVVEWNGALNKLLPLLREAGAVL